MSGGTGPDERALAAQALRLAAGRPEAAVAVSDWPALLRLAAAERLAPLAWLRSGVAIAGAAGPEVAARWRGQWLSATARAHAAATLAGDFSDALERETGAAPVILKGAPLAQRLYGDPGARPGVDVDCHVPLDARAAARVTALSLGWTHAFGAAPDDEGFVRETAHGELFLELHTSLLGERLSFLPLPAPAGAPVDVGGARLVGHDDALLPGYLAAHLATHTFPPLLWWLDVAELWARLDDAGRDAARDAAHRAGLARYLRWALDGAAAVRRAIDGDESALRQIGYGDARRRDVHQLRRHVALAPDARSAAIAIRRWLRPPWAGGRDGGLVIGTARRVARHWRALLPAPRPARSGDVAPSPAGSAAAARVTATAPEELVRIAREVTAVGGEMWLVVTGRSMTPAIGDGDLVLLAACPSLPRRGMVVLIEAGAGGALLHRVARVVGRRVVTRGDACQRPDQSVEVERVVAIALALRRGRRVTALVPTLRFGGAPFARWCWWAARRRLRAVASTVRGGGRRALSFAAPPAAGRAGRRA